MLNTNMLMPQAYEPEWTWGTWQDGAVFNDYPPPPPAPGSPAAAAATAAAQAAGPAPAVGVPNGTVKWANPCVTTGIPLNSGTPASKPVLPANVKRNLLIIQNNSTATAPDVAPNLLVNFGSRVQFDGSAISLAPGAGLVLDVVCPRNEVYVAFRGAVGGTAIAAGGIQIGAHTLDSIDPMRSATAGAGVPTVMPGWGTGSAGMG